MKILHVINSLGTGGAEKLVADLAPLQRDAGNAVEVLLLRGGATPFRENLEKAGVRVHDFGAGTSVYSPLHVFRLMPFLRKCDVVHVHLFPAQYWVAFAKMLSGAKTRLITTEHSTSNRRRGIPGFRFFDKFVYGRYAKIACCAEIVKTTLTAYLRMQENISCIPNGVGVAEISTAIPERNVRLSFLGKVFILIQVARFAYPKKQDTLIRALRLLPEYICVLFVGDGELRAECESLAEKLGVHHRTCFLGFRRDIPSLLKTADAVICSSEYEGLSLASVEGMAAGKPVVASDVPGLAEVVGGAGLLFPQGDEKTLSATILRLAEDGNFYAETATACSRRAADFDIRETCAAYLKIYGAEK